MLFVQNDELSEMNYMKKKRNAAIHLRVKPAAHGACFRAGFSDILEMYQLGRSISSVSH